MLDEADEGFEDAVVGLLEVVGDDKQFVGSLLRERPPARDGRVEGSLAALLWARVQDRIRADATGCVEGKSGVQEGALMWLEAPPFPALVQREAVVDEGDRVGRISVEASGHHPPSSWPGSPLRGPERSAGEIWCARRASARSRTFVWRSRPSWMSRRARLSASCWRSRSTGRTVFRFAFTRLRCSIRKASRWST